MSDDDKVISQKKSRDPRAMRALLLGGTLGAIVTGGFILVVGALLFRETLPQLTPQQYEAAVKRWEQSGVKSYRERIELFGTRQGVVEIEVHQGKPVKMTRDGVEPTQQRTWEAWSVQGQFDMISQELELAQAPPDAVGSTGRVFLSAKFDDKLGYPLLFRRVGTGAANDIAWKIVSFEPVEQKSDDSP